MKDLRGANAIVTGGSRGIGPYIARALAREGVNITLAARDKDRLEAVRVELEGLGVRAVSIPTDVTVREDRARLVERASGELGPIDLLVNNAGIEPTNHFVRLDDAAIEDTIATNLTASALLMRQVLPGMLERGRGHVVNIASLAGKVPVPYDSIYSATKFALVGLTHAIRGELRGSGVGVSVICPGFISDAGMFADVQTETQVKAPAIASTSKPEKVAAAVVRAVRHDVAEVIVNPPTGRPLLAVAALAPTVGQAMMRQTGIVAMMRQVAEHRASGS